LFFLHEEFPTSVEASLGIQSPHLQNLNPAGA
jgi:hypothetical protein